MSVDPGDVVSVIQIIALILLTIGVYPYRIRTKNRNLILHGFLAIIALMLNVGTVLYVMIPSFLSGIVAFGELTLLQEGIVLAHAITGVVAIALGVVIIVSWVTHPLGELGCSRTWRFMIPTFIIWALSIVLGLTIHFFAIL